MEHTRFNATGQAERSTGRLSRNKKKKLLKYGKLTEEENHLLRLYQGQLDGNEIICAAVDAKLTLKAFLQTEEENRKRRGIVVDRQLASLNPMIISQKKQTSDGRGMQNLFLRLTR